MKRHFGFDLKPGGKDREILDKRSAEYAIPGHDVIQTAVKQAVDHNNYLKHNNHDLKLQYHTFDQ